MVGKNPEAASRFGPYVLGVGRCDKKRPQLQVHSDMENKNHILERAVQSVDMRLSDRVFIKYAPSEMPPQPKNNGRET